MKNVDAAIKVDRKQSDARLILLFSSRMGESTPAQNEDISAAIHWKIDCELCASNRSRSKLNVGQYQVISIKRLFSGAENAL